jgi:adenylate kinase
MDAGQLVPDALVLSSSKSASRAKTLRAATSSTGFRATSPSEALLERGVVVERVVNVVVPTSALLGRLTGRRVCQQCGATYHVDTVSDGP